jgi:hypothetical protein
MRLVDILLVHDPNSSQDSTASPQAWYPPPFLANPNQTSRTGAEEVSTPTEIAAFLKSVYQPAVQPGKQPAELCWVTTTLTNHPVDDNLPRYKAWETKASLFFSIDVLEHHTGVRHSALEGHTAPSSSSSRACYTTWRTHQTTRGPPWTPPPWKTSLKASPLARERSKAWQPSSSLSFATRSATRPHCWRSKGLSSRWTVTQSS